MADMLTAGLKKDDTKYELHYNNIQAAHKIKTAQYIGEGATFLALILVGAVFVYRATRRQILLSQQQQNFMMAVTHELKTPIAITRLNLETLQKRKLDEEKQNKLISNTLQEADRLNNLCNNILLTAQLESSNYLSTKQEINFSDLVEGCVEDFQNRFPQRKLEANISEGIYLHGEQLLLQMLVNNLIDNAKKYSPKEQPIALQMNEQNNSVVLKIIDRGAGVADDEKKKIFDKFYRTGDENTRRAKGTGLGLYLCKKIMQAHNGYISVTDREQGGSTFTATFKIK